MHSLHSSWSHIRCSVRPTCPRTSVQMQRQATALMRYRGLGRIASLKTTPGSHWPYGNIVIWNSVSDSSKRRTNVPCSTGGSARSTSSPICRLCMPGKRAASSSMLVGLASDTCMWWSATTSTLARLPAGMARTRRTRSAKEVAANSFEFNVCGHVTPSSAMLVCDCGA